MSCQMMIPFEFFIAKMTLMRSKIIHIIWILIIYASFLFRKWMIMFIIPLNNLSAFSNCSGLTNIVFVLVVISANPIGFVTGFTLPVDFEMISPLIQKDWIAMAAQNESAILQ